MNYPQLNIASLVDGLSVKSSNSADLSSATLTPRLSAWPFLSDNSMSYFLSYSLCAITMVFMVVDVTPRDNEDSERFSVHQ